MKKQLLYAVLVLFTAVQIGNARPGIALVVAENTYAATRMYEAPTASIVGFTSNSICSGTATALEIQGTPNAIVNYTINGVSQPDITLSNTGTFTIDTGILSVATTTTFTYTLTTVQSTAVPPEESQSANIVGETATLTVYDLPFATFTSSTPSICEATWADLIFAGTPNATVTYSDGSNNFSIVLDNTGGGLCIWFTTLYFNNIYISKC